MPKSYVLETDPGVDDSRNTGVVLPGAAQTKDNEAEESEAEESEADDSEPEANEPVLSGSEESEAEESEAEESEAEESEAEESEPKANEPELSEPEPSGSEESEAEENEVEVSEPKANEPQHSGFEDSETEEIEPKSNEPEHSESEQSESEQSESEDITPKENEIDDSGECKDGACEYKYGDVQENTANVSPLKTSLTGENTELLLKQQEMVEQLQRDKNKQMEVHEYMDEREDFFTKCVVALTQKENKRIEDGHAKSSARELAKEWKAEIEKRWKMYPVQNKHMQKYPIFA